MEPSEITLRTEKGSALSFPEHDANFSVVRELVKNWVSRIEQPSHSLSEGNVVYLNGGTWVKARADVKATASAQAIVVGVIDSGEFLAMHSGVYTKTAHGYAVGSPLYLSQSLAGVMTATEPESGIKKPVGFVLDADQIFVNVASTSMVEGAAAEVVGPKILAHGRFSNSSGGTVQTILSGYNFGSVVRLPGQAVFGVSFSDILPDTNFSVTSLVEGWSLDYYMTIMDSNYRSRNGFNIGVRHPVNEGNPAGEEFTVNFIVVG